MWETWVWSLGWGGLLEKGMVTHSSLLAWRIPWREESGGLQSIVLRRVRHDWATDTSTSPYPFPVYSVILWVTSKMYIRIIALEHCPPTFNMFLRPCHTDRMVYSFCFFAFLFFKLWKYNNTFTDLENTEQNYIQFHYILELFILSR